MGKTSGKTSLNPKSKNRLFGKVYPVVFARCRFCGKKVREVPHTDACPVGGVEARRIKAEMVALTIPSVRVVLPVSMDTFVEVPIEKSRPRRRKTSRNIVRNKATRTVPK